MPTDLTTWLAAEVADIEARLQGAGPTCQLDRQRASPPSLKAQEGRYFVLRRAARLIELGQSPQALGAEADKARAFLSADEGLARVEVWVAYHKAVLEAVEELRRHAGAAWARSAPSS